jgi:hypothetical protein
LEAQFKLAGIYAQTNRDRDLRSSIKWLKMAASEGHAESQYNLGLAYYHGKGVKKDLAVAADWYRGAGLNGQVKSQRNLAHMYEVGEGVNSYFK